LCPPIEDVLAGNFVQRLHRQKPPNIGLAILMISYCEKRSA
jgi:hypothetical protein